MKFRKNILLPIFFIPIVFLFACENITKVVKPEISYSPFNIEIFYDKDVPEYYKEALGGGCFYHSQGRSEENLMLDGLIKVNGLFEKLEYTSWDEERNTIIYENSKWILNIKTDSNNPNFATMQLRSKVTDGVFEKKAEGGCGT